MSSIHSRVSRVPHVPVPALIVGNGEAAARAVAMVDAARTAMPVRSLMLLARFAADPPLLMPPELTAFVEVRRTGGACACCVGAVVFRVALVRWLREVRPAQVLIESPPGWHLDGFAKTLRSDAYADLVRIEGVLDLDRRSAVAADDTPTSP